MERKVRVRFAPSPTGPLHIGGLRTAVYNYLFAKQNQGDFLLRIEDTDQARTVEGAEEYIIEALQWCNIEPNEGWGFGDGPNGPYKQSLRKDIYKKYAEQLVEKGHAYYAFDTPEEIEKMRQISQSTDLSSYNYITRESMKNALTLSNDEVKKRINDNCPYVIRIKIPRKKEIKAHDLIRGNMLVHSSSIDDKVLFKSDGMPTYHLANVVDDYLMNITHIIRGEEWLPSLPLHLLLYDFLGFSDRLPQFAHLPLILKPDGQGKLSKRDGDKLGFPVFPLAWKNPTTQETSMGYREEGYISDALINYLSLLGWSPGDNREVMSRKEMLDSFSIERVSKSGAKFDPIKAKWMNQQHLKQLDEEVIVQYVENAKHELTKDFSKKYVSEVASLFKERLFFFKDFFKEATYMFVEPHEYDARVLKKRMNEASMNFIKGLLKHFQDIELLSDTSFETAYNTYCEKQNIGLTKHMQFVRLVLTGTGGGPPLFKTMALLSKEKVLHRFSKFINIFDA